MHSGNSSFFNLGIGQNQQTYAMQQVPVQGQWPAWLQGSYIRNGPGMFQLPQRRMRHWFDAMGALHKFDFAHGQVNYLCRFIDCHSYQSIAQDGTMRYSEFATDPCKSMFGKVMSYFIPQLPKMTDNPKVNIARLGKQWMALGETQMQVEFDPQTLQSIGVREYAPKNFAYKTTAHPHFDGDAAWNVVVKFGMLSFYQLYNTARPGSKPLCSFQVKEPAYLHGFGMSGKYLVIVAPPLVVNPVELLFWRKPYIENHRWKPALGTTFYVIDKATGKLRGRYTTDAFFLFHHVNAWDDGDKLVMDINAYDDAAIVQSYYLNQLEQPDMLLPKGTLRRYTLQLSTGHITQQLLSQACIELPRMDYGRYNTRPDYGYCYAVSVHPQRPTGFYNSLVKIAVENGHDTYWHTPGCYPGEPCFVPAPHSSRPGEGVLLSIVLDTVQQTSFLLVLDATNMQELARATVPHPILYGFHGEYLEG